MWKLITTIIFQSQTNYGYCQFRKLVSPIQKGY